MPKASKKKKASNAKKKAPKKKVPKAIKAPKKKAPNKKEEAPKEENLGEEIGKVTHYFTKIGVCVVELSADLKVGDTIHIKGATSDFKQKVASMQIEHEKLEEAKKGQSIGMKVKEHAREHDKVFKVTG
jgi:putative protease